MPDSSAPTTLYRLFDTEGALLYVGIAGNPGRRWEQHRKDKPWWGDVASTRLEHFATREEAAAAELEAIRTEDPRHNIVGRGGVKPGQERVETGFTGWLRQQRRRNDMVGDLARDAKHDPGWPRPTTIGELVRYIDETAGWDRRAVDSARLAWSKFLISKMPADMQDAWRRACQLEPAVQNLRGVALNVTDFYAGYDAEDLDPDEEPFCAHDYWYTSRLSLRSMVVDLVGWCRERDGDPWLRTTHAYDAVYRVVHDALPDCRGECGCFPNMGPFFDRSDEIARHVRRYPHLRDVALACLQADDADILAVLA